MMKKILRTILRAIPVVLVLVFCLSVTAMAYSGSESVTLKTTQNEATSGSLSCHHAKVSATNSASSQPAPDICLTRGIRNYSFFKVETSLLSKSGFDLAAVDLEHQHLWLDTRKICTIANSLPSVLP